MITRKFVPVPEGVIHCAIAGAGRPVLLLHQTPRSWDEYRDVLPLLGQRFQAIAMDTIGYGDSSKPPLGSDTVEGWARTAVSVLDALGIARAAMVGHHTGAVIASEIAGAFPDRVEAAVLSAMPFVDEALRKRRFAERTIDDFEHEPDGSHLVGMWRMRQPWYPNGDVDLLDRFIVDALKAGSRAAEGHRVVWRYDMPQKLGRIRCPTLILAPTADEHVYRQAPAIAARIKGSRVVDVPGGMVPLPDQMPQEFARLVGDFLSAV